MIDKYEITELRILQLLDSVDKWWTIEEIGSQLLLSKASTQKYISLLKARINEFSVTQIQLKTSPSKGIFLSRSPSFTPQFLYAQILKELLVFSIFNTFFNRKSIPVLQMAMDNFSSVASIRRKYKDLNYRFMERGFDMTISKDTLQGNERQIRWFYSSFYWKVFKGTEWPFPAFPRNLVEDKIKKIQQSFDITFFPEVTEKMIYWFVVNWSRYRLGYRVNSDVEIKAYCLHHDLFLKFSQVLSQIFPEYAHKENSFDREEVEYLFFLVSALPLLDKNYTFNDQVYQAHKNAKTLIYKTTQEWLRLFMHSFGYQPNTQTRCLLEYELLRMHSYSYLFKAKPYFIFEDNEEKEKRHSQTFKDKLKQIYDTLQQMFPSTMESKDYLLESYTHLALSLLDINCFEKTVRIYLSFSKGSLYEGTAHNKIMARLGNKYNIRFVQDEKDKDIFITDLPHPSVPAFGSSLSVNPKLTERDYHNIETTILSLI